MCWSDWIHTASSLSNAISDISQMKTFFKHCFRVHYNFAAFFRTLILQTGFWRASPFLKFQWIFKNKSQTLFEGFDFWKKAAVATDLAILCNLIRQLFEFEGHYFKKSLWFTICGTSRVKSKNDFFFQGNYWFLSPNFRQITVLLCQTKSL